MVEVDISKLIGKEELHKAFQKEAAVGLSHHYPIEEVILRLEWAYSIGMCHQAVLSHIAGKEALAEARKARDEAMKALIVYLEQREKV